MKFSPKSINISLGWIMFVIASTVYILTTEPTTSLWDCPEYISTAVKLEVGHPPGAPLFQMMGAVIANMFSVDPTNVAFMMNVFACLSSGVSIMLLFWIITYFARRISGKTWDDISKNSSIAVFGSGIVGASAIMFSDTFWFNATEAEVYSLANTFTVLVFYLATRWANGFGKPNNNKWLLLISLIIGLGPGVHFMVLLAIPTVVLIYYFKTEENITTKKFIIANIIAAGILLLVFAVIFPMLIKSFGAVEIFFVNSVGLPFHSGTIIWVLFLAAVLIGGMYLTQKKQWFAANTAILSLTFIIIGFSCYLMIPIRSNANTPINENKPSTAVGLLSYFHREQYGSMNRTYGPMYNSNPDYSNPYIIGDPIYEPNKSTGRYEVIEKQLSYRYKADQKGLFPRISNNGRQYAANYRKLTGLKEGETPKLSDNIGFFFTYQLGYMNFRYFMWNFTGRQNDIAGNSEPHKGNWISGIKPIDEFRLGPQVSGVDFLDNNKAKNTYFFLPLILGLIGLYFHFKKNDRDAYATLMFFIITGIGITLYSNNPPYEPRERDYAIAVSFWTFGIWIGLGVMGIYTYLQKVFKGKNKTSIAIATSAVCFLAVPTLMGTQNWDDHDRSLRSTARATGLNYLSSVGKNGILVTYGDNDTFTPWYMQEVEGYRTDVRVLNTSLFMTDWYIEQMGQQFYDSPALPIGLREDDPNGTVGIPLHMYKGRRNEVIYFLSGSPFADKYMPVQTFIKLLASEHPSLMQEDYMGTGADVMYPTHLISIPVNKENALKYGIVSPEQADKMVDTIHIQIAKTRKLPDGTLEPRPIEKTTLAFLDLMASYQWDRPIHFAIAGGNGDDENTFGLSKYLILEGMTYKLVPIEIDNVEQADGPHSYDIIKKNWVFGGLDNPKTYLTDTDARTSSQIRQAMSLIAKDLAAEGDTTRAREIVRMAQEKMPIQFFEPSFYTIGMINAAYKTGDTQFADSLSTYTADQLEKYLIYLYSMPEKHKTKVYMDAMRALTLYDILITSLDENDSKIYVTRKKSYDQLLSLYRSIFPFVSWR